MVYNQSHFMSEVVVDEDPEPLSGGDYNINLETGLAFEGYDLADDLARQEDRTEVVKLSLEADAILARAGYGLNEDDVQVEENSHRLRRRIRTYEDGEHFRTLKTYFYIDSSQEPKYCRQWTNESERVNYCLNELRHERAYFVRAHVEVGLNVPEEIQIVQQQLGKRVLAKLLHFP
jgi:hypothetical protein